MPPCTGGFVATHNRLIGIQAARGVAALLVVLYHTGRMVAVEQYVGHDPFYGVFSFGHAGVDFFFVLSGFIIFFVHQSDVGRTAHIFRYAWRRVTRIYPIYWIVTLLAIGFGIAGHHTDLSVWRVIASLCLLPQADDPIVGVAWTLEHEVLFYGVFAALILNVRVGVMLCAAWLALVFTAFIVPLPGVVLPFAASAYHLDFFLGMASAWLVLQEQVPSPRICSYWRVLVRSHRADRECWLHRVSGLGRQVVVRLQFLFSDHRHRHGRTKRGRPFRARRGISRWHVVFALSHPYDVDRPNCPCVDERYDHSVCSRATCFAIMHRGRPHRRDCTVCTT